jgi:SET domain-containing protein
MDWELMHLKKILLKEKLAHFELRLFPESKQTQKAGRMKVLLLWNNKALGATINSNQLRYINHSSSPHTCRRAYNNHVELYSLIDICPGEETTCNYGPSIMRENYLVNVVPKIARALFTLSGQSALLHFFG